MPKPIFGQNGSGMHMHQSLYDIKRKRNVFFDAKDPYKLSAIAKSYIAGLLEHIRAMSGVLSPTVNSYKRLVPGYEAPVYISWAQKNRSALIRIPRYSEGREEATRCELRCPDPACNPYLAFALILKAGLDGVKRNLKLRAPTEENLYELTSEDRVNKGIDTLPQTLFEAIEEMKKDKVVRETLGAHTFERYVLAKTFEWDQFRLQVTKWEHDTYFDNA